MERRNPCTARLAGLASPAHKGSQIRGSLSAVPLLAAGPHLGDVLFRRHLPRALADPVRLPLVILVLIKESDIERRAQPKPGGWAWVV